MTLSSNNVNNNNNTSQQQQQQNSNSSSTSVVQNNGGTMFSVGEKVKVNLTVEASKHMQEGHGGWNQKMADVIFRIVFHILVPI